MLDHYAYNLKIRKKHNQKFLETKANRICSSPSVRAFWPFSLSFDCLKKSFRIFPFANFRKENTFALLRKLKIYFCTTQIWRIENFSGYVIARWFNRWVIFPSFKIILRTSKREYCCPSSSASIERFSKS